MEGARRWEGGVWQHDIPTPPSSEGWGFDQQAPLPTHLLHLPGLASRLEAALSHDSLQPGPNIAGSRERYWGLGFAFYEDRFYFYQYGRAGRTERAVWELPDQNRVLNQIAIILNEPAWTPSGG